MIEACEQKGVTGVTLQTWEPALVVTKPAPDCVRRCELMYAVDTF